MRELTRPEVSTAWLGRQFKLLLEIHYFLLLQPLHVLLFHQYLSPSQSSDVTTDWLTVPRKNRRLVGESQSGACLSPRVLRHR